MSAQPDIKFRNGEQVLTLYPERTYDDGWVLGWCPELSTTMSVHPENVLTPDAVLTDGTLVEHKVPPGPAQ